MAPSALDDTRRSSVRVRFRGEGGDCLTDFRMKLGFVAKHRRSGALGCLAGWLLCLADATAQPKRRGCRRKVRASFLASDRIYGARRVWHDPLAEGIS